MRELIKICIFAVAVLLLGCALAPPIYWLGHSDFANSIYSGFSEYAFHRYFNRAVLVAAAILLWPLLRAIGVRSFADAGLLRNPRRWRDLALGFTIASLGLWAMAAVIVGMDRADIRVRIAFDALPGAMLSAVVVALIEEGLFRGALFGALRRSMPWRRALVALSVVFAGLHFLKPPRGVRFDEVGFGSGFVLLPKLFWQYGEPRLLIGGFLTLFLVSLVLGYTVIRTRSLFAALGLHAGWVFALKGFGIFARIKGPPDLWLGRDLLTGVAPVLVVSLSGLLLVLFLRKRGTS